MNKLSKNILKTVKVKKASKTVKKSKTVKMTLKKTLKMANITHFKLALSKTSSTKQNGT